MARVVFARWLYRAVAAASATMLAMVTRPMNKKIIRQRVIHPAWFHLAIGRQSFAICDTCLAALGVPK
jgi:hypothetical protein